MSTSRVPGKNVQESHRGSCEEGVALSASQLDLLWKEDFKLAHELLGLPLRICKAAPNTNWGEAMESEQFAKFMEMVRRMWILAAFFFEVYLHEKKGWGLRVNKSFDGKL